MTTNLFPRLVARWQARWKKEDMAWRLRELFIQSIGYVLMTLAMIGIIGSVAYTFLPLGVAEPGLIFLAIIYLLLLLITTVRLFDNNHTKYLTNKIEDIEDLIHEFMTKEGCE
jgi:hypothetical protein